MEILASIPIKVTCMFSFWIRLGIICPSHMFYFENGSLVTFLELMEFDLCWKCLVLSFSHCIRHHAYLRLKEYMHSSTRVVFCIIKLFLKMLTILFESIKEISFLQNDA